MSAEDTFEIVGRSIPLGANENVRLLISQTYTGDPISIPVRVIRGICRDPTSS